MSTLTNDVTHLRPEEKRALLEKLLRERKNQAIPLSSAQKRLWFLDKLHPGSAVYNVPTVLRLRGPLEVERLRRGLETIVSRHQALRTVFAEFDGAPVQKIKEAVSFDLPLADLSSSRGPAQTREMERRVSLFARKPFDLARDLMLRAEVIRLSPQDHLLVLVTHHIASDEWSLRVLLRELGELYRAEAQERPADLPEVEFQYSDFARAQQEWLESEACRQQLHYWSQQLKGAQALELPCRGTRPAEQTFNGAAAQRVYSAELLEKLKRLSQEQHATLFMTLLAAFKVVLHRYSQQEDLVVGCPIAGRTRVETEGLIGFFVNTLAIRTHVNPGQTFRELLGQVRERTLSAYANQEVPFDRIVEEIQPDRTPGRMPLVQAVFALNNDYVGEQFLPGLSIEEIETGTGTSKFDLTFVTKQTSEGLSAIAEYNSELFDARFIERFLGHFEQVLRDVAENPNERIGRLRLLTDAEREYLVQTLNATSRPYPESDCVQQVFEAQVARTPDAIALNYDGETITYRELNARANQLAHFLQKEKAAGSLAGVYMERSISMIVAFLGILKAGGAYVPLDLSYPRERLAFMIHDARMGLILTDSEHIDELPLSEAAAVAMDSHWERIQQEPRQLPPSPSNPNSLAYVIYTSGSTGTPKGVPVPHRGITRLVCNPDYVAITPEDKIGQASNASFDAATFEIWGALLNGACAIGISKETALAPAEFAEKLRAERITILFLTTALFNQLAREAPGAFGRMNTVLFGGEAVDPKWVRAVLACDPPQRLLHVYGPTENTTFSTWQLISEVAEDDATVPIGKPIANSELYILDRELEPVPLGIPGEVYVGGDGLAHGYWQRPELTAARFLRHPFREASGARLYKTGDLARFNENGEVEFIGRIDHQVKLRGFRIELGEIETLLAKHPGVSNAVVLLREDAPGDKRLVAYIVAEDRKNAAASSLRDFLRGQLPEYMLPSTYVFLEALPLTPNEKIDRKALPAPERNRSGLDRSFVPPRDEVEKKLAAVWERVLGVTPVGISDNFFELGGHSLLAVKVFTQIEKELEKKLPLATLFRAPTVEQLARVLRADGANQAWSTLVDIQPKGSRPPFFWIHTLGGDGGGGFFYYRKLAELLGAEQPSYGVRSPQQPFTRIEEMAHFYVQEIKKFQPEGPYFLGGFCFGGNVAYEMAQTFLAQGDEVGLLVLLESSPPNVDQRQSWTATAAKYSLENLVENVKEFVNVSPQKQLAMLKTKSKRLKQKIRTKIAQAAEDSPKPVELKDVIDLEHYPEGYVQYAETHWQALTAYHPQPYSGELVLFRARKQGLSNFNHTLGWDALVGDRVEVNVIPGTHESMLQEPNVQIVASKIRALLSRVQHRGVAPRERELLAAV